MALGYWDNYVSGVGTYAGSGRLIDYWQEKSYWSSGSGVLRNVPNMHEELRIAMATSASGVTLLSKVSPAIKYVANSKNYYGYGSNMYIGSSGNDYLWNTIRYEVTHNRPFVWSVGRTGIVGHSLCGWGYTDTKYVITYNTWVAARDDWYYRKYDNGAYTNWQYLNNIIPNGREGTEQVIIKPLSVSSVRAGSTLTFYWYRWGTLSRKANLYYSVNGGGTWSTIALGRGTVGGWNHYHWRVPSRLTSRARIRVYGYYSTVCPGSSYIAGDGLQKNFRIISSSSSPALQTCQVGGPVTNSSPTQAQHTLTVESSPMSGVVITGTPSGTANYTSQLDHGSEVSLTAPAKFADGDAEYTFVRWLRDGRALPERQATLSFDITADTTVIAIYQARQGSSGN
jgi:hypothetical protein